MVVKVIWKASTVLGWRGISHPSRFVIIDMLSPVFMIVGVVVVVLMPIVITSWVLRRFMIIVNFPSWRGILVSSLRPVLAGRLVR